MSDMQPTHRLRLALALCAFALLAAEPAVAQPVLLRGSVVDTLGKPLRGIEIILQRAGHADRTTRSDTAGRFVLAEVVPGDWALMARAIGKVLQAQRVRLAPGDTVDADITMYPVVTTLAQQKILIDGTKITYGSPRLREFYERKAQGMGYYWSAEDFAKRPAPDSPSLVGRMPFVRITTDRWGRERFSFTRGSLNLEGCNELFFWDGFLTDGAQIVELLRATPPEFLAGIELYRSSATLPARFAVTGGACGVVAFWTK
jgi:hypothetical protein